MEHGGVSWNENFRPAVRQVRGSLSAAVVLAMIVPLRVCVHVKGKVLGVPHLVSSSLCL